MKVNVNGENIECDGWFMDEGDFVLYKENEENEILRLKNIQPAISDFNFHNCETHPVNMVACKKVDE